MSDSAALSEVLDGLEAERCPYLGPGVWFDRNGATGTSADPLQLVANSPSPSPCRTAAHKPTGAGNISKTSNTARRCWPDEQRFSGEIRAQREHKFNRSLHKLPLVVNTWYDDAMQVALAQNPDWVGSRVSQAEHYGEWVRYYTAQGELSDADAAKKWQTPAVLPLAQSTGAELHRV